MQDAPKKFLLEMFKSNNKLNLEGDTESRESCPDKQGHCKSVQFSSQFHLTKKKTFKL